MKQLFNDGWKFKMSDESDFRDVKIPHDWLIYNACELYASGVGCYKKDFEVKEGEQELVFSLIFDGVYMDSSVFVNGKFAGEWKYGYTAFCIDISTLLKIGFNEIEVRVNHAAPNTRWYSGAGIYRNVWLNKQEKTHIINDGIYISSEKLEPGFWILHVQTEYEGVPDSVRHTLTDADGKIINVFETVSVIIENPYLWDIENPHVYRLKTELIENNKTVDTEINPVGFREVVFSPSEGFILNGRKMKMHGVCLHHDLGAFGAAFDKDAARRQLEIMREMGVNAIRISHNPPAREYIDICDEMGLLVIDEAFDMWELPKNKNDYARFFKDWHIKDTASWVRRDRNHPSVIMWSIGNEIYDTHKDEKGLKIAEILRDEVLKHDPRMNAQVTIASNFMPFPNAQKVADEIKSAGYNYAENLYDLHHEEHPDWFIYGSETASAVRSRGIYRFPAEMPVLSFEDMQCSDLGNSVVGWGRTSESAWIMDRDRGYCGGQFIWTGMDYIGEPTPYPAKNSYFGAVDTAGFPKAAFYFYRAVWNKTAPPFIKLFPHWDWNEGQIIDVIAYSNMEEAELFLNNKSLGRQKIDLKKGQTLHFSWKVIYEKGELLINAYDKDGNITAHDKKVSFGEVSHLLYDTQTFGVLHFIRIYAVDEDGEFVENARNRVFVEITGENTELIGLDNGDSTDYDSYKGTSKRLFGGLLLAIVKGDIERIKFNMSKDEIPLRKAELSAANLIINKDNNTVRIDVKLLPENTDYRELAWKCVLDTGAVAGNASVKGDESGAVVTATGDGKFKVRAVCNNGKPHPEIISELDFTVAGLGDAFKNPYEFIHAGRYDISYAPLKIIERGSVSGVNNAKTLIGFKNLDFGRTGADSLRLYLGTTSYFDEVLVELHIGNLKEENSRLLEVLSFPRNNLHYDFSPFDFKLCEKISGKKDICFTVDRRCVFGGFEFLNERAFNIIYACENDEIYGDNYEVNDKKIENIGNNVIMKFNALNLGGKSVGGIIISGFAPKGNSISLKLNERTILLEFDKSDNYITQRFDIEALPDVCDASFIFLPGSDFNFEWFRFDNK
ncbi:MAG: DUF4982 domain-containing protein [Oscillospiraceae bacterium]|nr:DUF4982 domain-containing protein [Oscillospiraceae bacterium]